MSQGILVAAMLASVVIAGAAACGDRFEGSAQSAGGAAGAPLAQGGAAGDSDVGGAAGGSGGAGGGNTRQNFCDSIDAQLCEDFDVGPRPWSLDIIETAGATLKENRTAFVSAPASVQARLPAINGEFQGATGRAITTLNGSPRAARLELDWRVDMNGSSATNLGSLLDIIILQGDGVGGIAVHHQVDVTGSPAYSVGPDFVPLPVPAPNRWQHLVVDVAWSDSSAAISVSVDGVEQATFESDWAPPESTLSVLVGGESAAGPTPDIWLSFDNITVDVTP